MSRNTDIKYRELVRLCEKYNAKIIQINYSNGKASGYVIGTNESYSLIRDTSKLGLVTGINHNGTRRLTMEYNSMGDIASTTYANGAKYTYNYGNDRRLQSIGVRDSAVVAPETLLRMDIRGMI